MELGYGDLRPRLALRVLLVVTVGVVVVVEHEDEEHGSLVGKLEEPLVRGMVMAVMT